MFTLTARRAPRYCGRTWTSTASGAILPPLIPGWQIPLYTGVAAVRHKSIEAASASPVRFVGPSRRLSRSRKKHLASGPGLLDIVTPEPKTEAWYDFFLSEDTFNMLWGGKPYYRYQSGRLDGLKVSLSEVLGDRPLAIFEKEHAPLANLRSLHQCLELYISRVRAASGDSTARQRYIDDAPGAKALLWSMSLSESDRHECWSSTYFMFPVVHCLVTEKNTDALWHWLELDHHLGPKNSFPYTSPSSSAWKNLLLRNMVETQIYWSDDSDCLADAMATIATALDKDMPIFRDAAWAVFKAMKRAGSQDEKAHDHFAMIVKNVFTREEQRDFMPPYLDLLHPTRPDTSGWLRLLRSDPPFLQEWFRPPTYRAGINVLALTCLLARKCAEEGRRSDAAWVLDHVYDRVPYLLSGGPGLRSFSAKVRGGQPNVMRKPSERELECKDIVLDEDGYLAKRDIISRKHRK